MSHAQDPDRRADVVSLEEYRERRLAELHAKHKRELADLVNGIEPWPAPEDALDAAEDQRMIASVHENREET